MQKGLLKTDLMPRSANSRRTTMSGSRLRRLRGVSILLVRAGCKSSGEDGEGLWYLHVRVDERLRKELEQYPK
jgi:hypothetical protein